jgi:DNA-directed RNA polymerase subunit beta'
LKHPDFVKGKTDGVTSDIRYVIKRSSFTQKEMKIPDHIIEESNISEAFKTLLYKQNKGEIEIIPATCLDVEYDPNMTTGYDFTVEDYKTFTTDTGIFLYDTMALFAPISEQAQQEIKDKMITLNNTTKIGASNFELGKEIVVGIFTMTVEIDNKTPIRQIKTLEEAKNLFIGQKVETVIKGKKIQTTAGRVVFNSILPEWYPFVDDEVDKKVLNRVFKEILLKNQKDYAIAIDKAMDIGFLYATKYPKSIDLEMLKIPPHLDKMRQQLTQTKDVSEQSDIIDNIEKEMMRYLKETHSDLYFIVASGGSKGSGQLRQMMICKGLISDPNGNILPPVTKAINEGYSPEEYFEVSPSSRKGTADRAINTGNGGYAYRKMIYCIGNTQADIANADCFTKRTMDIKLTKELFSRMGKLYPLINLWLEK